jgi:DNA polymerase-1
MLRKLLHDYQPEYIAVVFDARGKTFRDELFQAYKAHRPVMPEELAVQVEPLHAIVRAMGLPLLQVPQAEADDVIGTLARQAAAHGMPVVISTGDKDMAQLVDEHITLLDTMKNTLMDREGVKQKFGVPPERIPDYLALVGDSSDNIPGVPGVGPKTAAKWLQEYGSLDAIMASASAIQGKVGDKLRANLDQLILSRQLATIHCDLELELTSKQLHRRPPDTAALKDLFRRYEFSNWLRQLKETDPPTEIQRHYEIILDEATFEHWLEKLRAAELFAFDTETTHLDYQQARLVGLSFAVTPGQAAYVPLAHDYAGAPRQLGRDWVLEKLRPLLEDPQRWKLGQNLKYDLHVLDYYGIRLAGIRHDTMLESYVIDSTATRHDMDSLAERYLNEQTIRFEDVAGKGARQLSFNQIPLEQAGPYAAEDADITLRLHHRLWPRLTAKPPLKTLYEEIELPLIPVLAAIAHTGVLIDVEQLQDQSWEIAERLSILEQECQVLAGQTFNLGSPRQLQQILFEGQRLPVVKRTPTGQPSTAEDVLQELAMEYPLARMILEHRALAKLKSTYTDKLPRLINPDTARVHTSYQQAVASTGRLSSSDPNLQNIPIRSEEGRRIRRAFIAPPGYCILAADYSQIELRIMAHLSGDEGLLQAFAQGQDIHRATAAEVFGVSLEAVSSEQRRAAKAINFGLIYGMSAFGLARQLGIDRAAAQNYIDRYFVRYSRVRSFMEATRRQAAERGYVETLFGRRLYLTDIKARNSQRRQAAERTAINAPMQGTAADIIKRAMIDVDRWLMDSRLDARMIMQVHDELVFEVADVQVAGFIEEVKTRMQRAAQLSVPLLVEAQSGANWDEAH